MIDPEDIDWLDSAPGAVRESVVGKIKPLLLEPSSDKEWQAIGTIQYGNTLWEASFHVARNGDATYQQSRQIEKELPVSLDVFDNGIRVKQRMEMLNQEKPQRDLAKAQGALKANPKDEKTLRQLPDTLLRHEALEGCRRSAEKLGGVCEGRAGRCSNKDDDIARCLRHARVVSIFDAGLFRRTGVER